MNEIEQKKLGNLLMKFCATDNEILKAPYSVGDYTYATDGNILIKVPRMAEFQENQKAPNPEKIDIENPKKWYPIKGIKAPKRIDCETCEGQGKNFMCPECNGSGIALSYNDYNEYEVDCESCNSSGKMAFCESCKGTGKISQQKPIDFNGVIFDQRYLALLSELPNCEIGLISKTATTPFRFDGGTGIIMPIQYPVYLKKP